MPCHDQKKRLVLKKEFIKTGNWPITKNKKITLETDETFS
jgi:hypothetical protein